MALSCGQKARSKLEASPLPQAERHYLSIDSYNIEYRRTSTGTLFGWFDLIYGKTEENWNTIELERKAINKTGEGDNSVTGSQEIPPPPRIFFIPLHFLSSFLFLVFTISPFSLTDHNVFPIRWCLLIAPAPPDESDDVFSNVCPLVQAQFISNDSGLVTIRGSNLRFGI
jgi:hypothetical protein